MCKIKYVGRPWVLSLGLFLVSSTHVCYAQTNTFPSEGNVGIGTTSPRAGLEVAKESKASFLFDPSTTNRAYMEFDDSSDAYIGSIEGRGDLSPTRLAINAASDLYLTGAGNVGIVVKSSGNVGIGTTNPGEPLHIITNNRGTGIRLERSSATVGRYSLQIESNGSFNLDEEGIASRLTILKTSGNVGIGTTSPRAGLEVAKESKASFLFDLSTTNRAYMEFDDSSDAYIGSIEGRGDLSPTRLAINAASDLYLTGAGNVGIVVKSSGNVGIGTTSPSAKFHVAGDVTIDGNIAAKYQDVAEWVPVAGHMPPGTVMIIDPSENNRLLQASRPYDTRVAGVVSAQPGILLGEGGAEKAKVAHSGRVKVKVDAKYGAISVGDLLVSSPTPGHAMVSRPVEVNGIAIHRPGTIVGKALERLKEGMGEILVLLSL